MARLRGGRTIGRPARRRNRGRAGGAVPGRPAPRLVSAEMVASMRPGSVLIDLAVEQGGNVAGAVAGEVVETENSCRIVGIPNLASTCVGGRVGSPLQGECRVGNMP